MEYPPLAPKRPASLGRTAGGPSRLVLLFSAGLVAAAGTPADLPILKVTKAEYRLHQNVMEFSFTLTNHSDSVIFLDCQGQPTASRQGKTLTLAFAAGDAAGADTARPQRVGARQGYQGHRRIYGLGPDTTGAAAVASDPSAATLLKAEMAVYPERMEGEGPAWVLERAVQVSAKPAPLAKRGKRPKAAKPTRIIKPVE